MNGTQSVNQPAFPTIPTGSVLPKFTMEQVDPSALVDDDSDSDGDTTVTPLPQGLKPGKKTKGRVKIKMEFIENKLRRYTTFSKRKTGIMKKAYELSTLTGTQVMLLVASETGHVYTFATRKLQPMITSESGKALIQTCLNSPDPPPGSHAQISADQRMNPTGFEETELTYAVSEEENKLDSIKPVFAVANIPTSISEPGFVQSHSPVSSVQQSSPVSNTLSQSINQSLTSSQVTSLVQSQLGNTSSTVASTSVNNKSTSNLPNVSLQIPNLPPGALIVPQGTPLIPIQQNGQQITQQNTSQQTLYRLHNSNQIVSFPTSGTNGLQQQQISGSTTDGTTASTSFTNATTALNQVSSGATQAGTPAMTPGVVMYQTPQGIVYAPTTATLQDRSIFNFQQPATALSLPQTEGGQQIITIPVPVSLTGSPQVLQFATTPATDSTAQVSLSQPTAAKKARK